MFVIIVDVVKHTRLSIQDNSDKVLPDDGCSCRMCFIVKENKQLKNNNILVSKKTGRSQAAGKTGLRGQKPDKHAGEQKAW